MQLINSDLESQIDTIFQGIIADDLFSENGSNLYVKKFISVFNHWLNNEEYECIFFNDNKISEIEQRLFNLYKFLYRTYTVCAYMCSDYGGAVIIKFSSQEEYMDWVEISVKERLFLRILIPELKIIINGGYDYTLPTFLTKDADEKELEKIVSEHGLFILK